MKLSEAIRLGAMMKPQGFFSSLTEDGRTCALGAALDAIGQATLVYGRACSHFEITCNNAVHPITAETMRVLSIIRDLNDTHRWTRERIADWVASQEAHIEASSVDAVREDTAQPVLAIRA